MGDRRQCRTRLAPAGPVGPRLVAFVAERGHPNLKAAADAAGFRYRYLHALVTGRSVPRVDTLERFVVGLGGTLAGFFALELPPDPPPAHAAAAREVEALWRAAGRAGKGVRDA